MPKGKAGEALSTSEALRRMAIDRARREAAAAGPSATTLARTGPKLFKSLAVESLQVLEGAEGHGDWVRQAFTSLTHPEEIREVASQIGMTRGGEPIADALDKKLVPEGAAPHWEAALERILLAR
jgi:hypothetical protein